MATPRVLILRAPGSNCDVETEYAFEQAGGDGERIHINRIRENPAILHDYQILVIPGGFAYGDDVSAGKVLAVQLSHFLGEELRRFRDQEKLILGICNGFQALLKSGLVIAPDEQGPLATLTENISGKYEDRWVRLAIEPAHCVFLEGIESLYVPVAHGEGRFICRQEWYLHGLAQSNQLVMRYASANGDAVGYPDNPNGSQGDVAGVTDLTGRVLGLMPHPERNILPTHHPHWTRTGLKSEGEGMQLFHNAIKFFR